MKKLILILSLFVSVATLKAQQDAQYTQFFMNKLTFNPGYAGSEEKICASGLYRSQWLGFGSATQGVSPTTLVFNIHSPIGVAQRFGVGLNIKSDQLGFEQSVNPVLSGSYRNIFKNGQVLSLGVGVGLMQKSLAGDKLKPLDGGDSKIPTQAVSGKALDLNLGVYYTIPNLWRFTNVYAGISATHLTQGNVQYNWLTYTVDNPMKLHYYFMTGASYSLSPSLSLEPNILVKSDVAKTSADINVMAVYNQRIKGGLTYRTSDAIAILAGYQFSAFYLGYSYDFTTSKIINYSSGSHEIMLRYCFAPKFKQKPEKPLIPRLTPRFL